MKRNPILFLAVGSAAIAALAGCRGGLCSQCGAGYAYAPPTQAQPYAQPYAQSYSQPYIQPGVIAPQQIAPAQSQPGVIYGGGTR